jgi:hypothetical protein
MGWRILVFYPEPEIKHHFGVNFPVKYGNINKKPVKFLFKFPFKLQKYHRLLLTVTMINLFIVISVY